ncbi:threonine synthase [Pacificimonas flava]|uniref:Threonine synthase n=2 Tax=Pacificimonas TaxID=1960290 RepID=A0A219B2E1_9SPHN|nr:MULTISPECIES: threonine synthase [Pacificimonas]MBZ6378062.1 threonine synthase [Pacificimonas aurantium]OWV32296.1 threonine synthase [Pacificimonas flava]
MNYISTRGQAPVLDFEAVTLAGLASDGGLYVPEAWPALTPDELRALRGASYEETANAVIAKFVGDTLSAEEIAELTKAAYGAFSHAAVTPLVQLDGRHWLLELFHGPTLAFKDVALQLLGLLFEKFLTARGERLTIVGATSGDTGSAAINALAGRECAEVFMLHPAGRVSDVQRRQMTTVIAPNVHNLAIEGSFDDAQAHVKRMFRDPDMAGLRLSAVNSINWARLMAQIVYYVYAAVRLGAPDRSVAFSVPTGNFGDVFAGYVAARMGLPVERLIVATNVNDILHRALSAGDYSAGTVSPTAAPSMDIQVSSNFERLLFDLADRDPARLTAMMEGFDETKRLRLDDDIREKAAAMFSSARIDADEMSMTLQWAWRQTGNLIDPHTAIGLAAARQEELAADVPVVTLATAHPAKFETAVERATGMRPQLPGRLSGLMDRAEAYETLPGTYEAVRDFVRTNAALPA